MATKRPSLPDHAAAIARDFAMPVFVVHASKKPRDKGWTNGAARLDGDEVRALFADVDAKAFAVGIRMGSDAGDVVLVDCDSPTAIEFVKRQPEVFPATREQTTSKGRHYFYRLSRKTAIANSTSKIFPGLDVKASGGYAFDWSRKRPEATYSAIAPAPEALIRLLEHHSRSITVDFSRTIPNGARNDGLTSLAGKLRRDGLSQKAIAKALREHNAEHCKPPLPESEVDAIAKSVARYPSGDSVDEGELVVRRVAEIEAKELAWLVPSAIALGKVGFLVGDPGLGKSQVTLDLIAAITREERHPWLGVKHGEALILNAEDDVGDTLRPRLEAAGADLTKVTVIESVRVIDSDGGKRKRHFNLGRDVEALRRALAERPDVVLVVIDPISAYLGGVDSHKNTDVREVLAPLSALAAERGVTILGVSHLNKGGTGGNAIYRVSGSLAFVAAARFVFTVARDREDPDRRLYLPVKNNLAPDKDAYAYRVTGAAGGASRLVWEAGSVVVDADEALDGTRPSGKAERDRKVEKWLRDELGDGEKHASRALKAQARDLGFDDKRVDRVANAMGVRKIKTPKAWLWQLVGGAKRG